MNEPYSLILESLRGDNHCRATLRYSDGRTIGYQDAWAYPGAAYQLVLRVMQQYAPMLIDNGRIDSRVALNEAAARVMKKPGRKGAFLGTFTEPGEMSAVFALAAPGDVFIIYNQRTGGHHLYRITRTSRISAGINPFYYYTENLTRGTMEHAENALFRYAKVGACCAYPPVRKFWDWTPRGLSSVRFRLKPFEWLHCGYSWDNGEGTSWKRESYYSTWGGVEQVFSSGGRDCDGRTSEGANATQTPKSLPQCSRTTATTRRGPTGNTAEQNAGTSMRKPPTIDPMSAISWLPIETAPTDRQIMVWNAMTGPYRTQYDRDARKGAEWPLYNWSGIGGVWYPQPTLWAELSCFAPDSATEPRPIAGGLNPPADGGPATQLIRTLETELANLQWSLTSERKLGWDTRFREGQVSSCKYALTEARNSINSNHTPHPMNTPPPPMTPRREDVSHLITVLHCRRTGRYGARVIEAATGLGVACLTEMDASRLTTSLFVPGSGRLMIGHMEDTYGQTLPVIPGGRKELDDWLGACGIGWSAHQMPPLDAGYRGAMYIARAMMQPDPDVTVFRAIVENALKESPSQAMHDIAAAMETVSGLHKIRGGNPGDIAFKAQLMRADGEESVGFAANVPLRVIATRETDGSEDYDPADIYKCRWTGDAEDAAPRVCTYCEYTASEEFGAEYWQQLQPEGGAQ